MNGPPKKERGCNTAPKTAELREAYHVAPSVQTEWHREQKRLFMLYCKTRNARHWRAYCLHCAGMAARLEGRGQ
jgi:hypothetical protein